METVIGLARLYIHSLRCADCRIKFWLVIHGIVGGFIHKRVDAAMKAGGQL